MVNNFLPKDPLDPIEPLFKPEDQRKNEEIDLKREKIEIIKTLTKLQEQQTELLREQTKISKKQRLFNILLALATTIIAMGTFFNMMVYMHNKKILEILVTDLKRIYEITGVLFIVILVLLIYIAFKKE